MGPPAALPASANRARLFADDALWLTLEGRRRTEERILSDTHVVVLDDYTLNRECLVAQLAAHDLDVVGAWDLPSLFARLDGALKTVVVLNIDTKDSATLLQVVLDMDPRTRVIVTGLSPERESEIVACAEAGVAGLHMRSESFDHLLRLISGAGNGPAQCSAQVSAILLRKVYAAAAETEPGGNHDMLTEREREILRLLEQGLTNQQIASRLSVTVHTVKNHVHSVLTKLGVGSRSEAAAVARTMRFATVGAGEEGR